MNLLKRHPAKLSFKRKRFKVALVASFLAKLLQFFDALALIPCDSNLTMQKSLANLRIMNDLSTFSGVNLPRSFMMLNIVCRACFYLLPRAGT
ncbi:MAG: hypothetical protein SF029_09295 [bacterium]|nr:hypothetical protein [bacterium]